ncbi:exodeoxyribonuclease V subunit gamma [Nakamurella sp.]|uniref:exodeoxyribonuclease V subunit gamma n=1 Tax=Nakamurella sp. TaxID=1869182 RepID=UPI003B3AE5B9
MGVHVHRAERADTLAAALADLLATSPADPFALDVVAVPTRGVERWLTQRLSHRLGARDGRADGICTAVRFPGPAALLAELTGDRADDPWAPDAAVWPLLAVIDAAADEPWCALLAGHLGYHPADPHRQGRRYAVARRLAGLFAGYAEHRPAMLAGWAAGRDTDGWDGPVPADLAWQPELWRRLRERIGGPDPVQALAVVEQRLTEDPGAVDLPDRLSLFGPTAMPAAQVRLVSALAVHRQVHLWLPHPSPALWDTVRDRLDGSGRPVRRGADPVAGVVGHPLLASLGRDVRELQIMLDGRIATDTHHPAAGVGPVGGPAPTLLDRLHRALAGNRVPDAAGPSARADDSIRVHACHGPGRQVDVLRDVVVGLLADDPTLQPADILVMCPDIEAFAPLLQGAFGLAESVPGGHPAHRLRVRLADRALRRTNPLLAALERLLDLAGGRITASEVLDFAAFAPVRHRFGFDDDDVGTVADWVAEAGARWGLDAAHRADYGLSGFEQNTWRAALDRVLLGVCMAAEPGNRLGTALPLDEIGSADIDLAGRLAELVARLGAAVDTLTGRHTVARWCALILDAVLSLTAVPPRSSWQVAEVRAELAAVERHAAAAGSADLRLDLADIRALLAGALAGRPTRANFRTGTLTVCTMMPMRSVPHRVVCLLGLDDGVFPRAVREDGDDLRIGEPACGERDLRSEDRQLMLDAILAATDKLVVTYSGADERTGARRPPAVPLGELLDAVDELGPLAGGAAARTVVEVRHPLQPFDSRAVSAGALGRSGPFTFDPVALGGARALTAPRVEPLRLAAQPVPPPVPAADLELAALTDLLVHPAKGYLRRRLEVAVPFEQEDPPDDLPVVLDALQEWGVGDRLLRDRLAGVPEEECRQAEWRRGVLPPAALGRRTLEKVLADVRPLVDRTAGLRSGPRHTVEVSVELTGGRRLRGTVGGLYGRTLVAVSYSKLGARARLQAWLAFLALTASGGGSAGWSAVTVGRGPHARPLGATLPVLPADRAGDLLLDVVALHDAGLAAPLPLPLKTGEKYADARRRGVDPDRALTWAAQTWEGSATYPGENQDGANARVWGRDCSFADLTEPDRFVELAERLWVPLLQHEQRSPM